MFHLVKHCGMHMISSLYLICVSVDWIHCDFFRYEFLFGNVIGTECVCGANSAGRGYISPGGWPRWIGTGTEKFPSNYQQVPIAHGCPVWCPVWVRRPANSLVYCASYPCEMA